MKKFNTTGPCFPDEHYMMPALDRLPGIRELVADGNYFVVHAPRQTGKTTALKALVREINEKGEFAAIYCSLETIQKMMDVPEVAIREIRHLVLRGIFERKWVLWEIALPSLEIIKWSSWLLGMFEV